jgi:exopolysaccharide biosynthesis protein
MSKPLSKSAIRLIRSIVIDLLVLGVFLAAFSYFHFLRVPQYEPKALNSPETSAASPTPASEEAAAQPTASPAQDAASPVPEVIDTGLLGGNYAEKFTTGDVVEHTENAYRSANVCIEMTQASAGTESKPITYYIADIYIKDIASFRTAVAYDFQEQNEGSRKNVMSTLQLSQLAGSIVAISGDNFTYHDSIAVRNGVEWDKSLPVYGDICVLYYDGTMETYPEPISQAAVDEIYANNPLHIWTFGPELLEDGQVPSSFANSKANPLSAMGYYEPGHYCFILVDGRQKGYSWGMSLSELAQVFYDLGCTAAFNLDGGDTAVMTYGGEWRSQPQDASPRDTSDIIYICEPTVSANGQ